MVAGAAGWLKLVRPTLYPEDLRQLLVRTATDMGAPGFDVFFGSGRLDVTSATRFVLDNWIEHGSVGAGSPTSLQLQADSVTGITITLTNRLPGATPPDGTYPCVRYHLFGPAFFSGDFVQPPAVWVRKARSEGLPAVTTWDDAADISWAGISSVNPHYAFFDTYIYRLTGPNIFFPSSLEDARVEYTAVGPSGSLSSGPAKPGPAALLELHPLSNPGRSRAEFEGRGLVSGPVRVEVFDPAGRRIAKLFEGTVEAGRRRFLWDGRDHAGRTPGPGVYVCRIEQPNRQRACRFAFLR